MGASFRNTSQILELAGCDLLTISPELLAELQASNTEVSPRLIAEEALRADMKQIHLDQAHFENELAKNPMASGKLSEGIKTFCADIEKLEVVLR
jgi:transaldolase